MKLIQCLPTPKGPRTTVMQGLDPADAHMLADAVCGAGGDAVCLEDGPQINMREYLKAHAERRHAAIVLAAQAVGKIIPIKRG